MIRRPDDVAHALRDDNLAGHVVPGERLVELEPSLAATGHGRPWSGPQMLQELEALVENFDELAMPARGRYLREPAVTNEHGVVRVPPAIPDPLPKILAAAAVLTVAGAAINHFRRRGE